MGENEFTFSPDIFRNYYQLLRISPESLFRALFSYFGHYGVETFIFFSTYGLTRKYHQQALVITRFLVDRLDKIYLSFLLFILGNFNASAWIVSNITFTIIALATSAPLFRFLLRHAFSARFFMFFGNISFHLFMVNGFLRSPFHDFAETYHRWWIDNLAAVASLVFSTLCAYCLSALDNRLRAVFRSNP
jgi:peptidoglycan/LPS O-acetylase OafA/YrhL